jgi:hypothetical protein
LLVVRVTENVRAVQSSYYSSCPWSDRRNRSVRAVTFGLRGRERETKRQRKRERERERERERKRARERERERGREKRRSLGILRRTAAKRTVRCVS